MVMGLEKRGPAWPTMLPNLSGLCNINVVRTGAPAWFNEAELDYSNEVRDTISTAAEFTWQVYNEMQKYVRSKYNPLLTLEMAVARLLNYWHINEGYTPDMLMGSMIGIMTKLNGRISMMTSRNQRTEFEVPQAIKYETLNAAKKWLRGVKGGLTHEEEVNLNQVIKSMFR